MPVRTLLVLLLSGALCAGADEVTVGKQTIEGEIVGLSYKGVRLKKGYTFPWSKVRKILFDNVPAAYSRAERARQDGRSKAAIALYRSALKQEQGSVWLGQYARWRLAQAQLQLHQLAEVQTTLKALLTKYPETVYLIDAKLQSGRIQLARGQTVEARKTFTELRDKAIAERKFFSTRDRARASLWVGRTLLASGKSSEAFEIFSELHTSLTDAALARQAAVGMGRALQLQQKYTQSAQLLTQVIDKAQANERMPLSRAYGSLGECLLASASPDHAAALKAFLKVTMLFSDQLTEQPAALSGAVKCFQQLKRNHRQWASRQRTMQHELQKYRDLPWIKPGWRLAGLGGK